MALVNVTNKLKRKDKTRGRTEPGLVAFYDFRPGNESGIFCNPGAPRDMTNIGSSISNTCALYMNIERFQVTSKMFAPNH